jgi:2-polyprenyl-6-methoxyphenol hydroxylase-like FAD-dependent oxidoreductase
VNHPVAIVGAGPIGLAAAANAAERGLPFVVLESGPVAGAAVGEWAHVRLFSAWRELVDPAARRLLEEAGTWAAPEDDAYPTGGEWREQYLQPLADLLDARAGGSVRYGAEVVGVGRASRDLLVDLGR